MITPLLRKSLSKQGYKLLGSHSGVKMCRWTKSMLRGRGGCYKHTFYGIESHRCMETTPSLACANKCVFCWRYTNSLLIIKKKNISIFLDLMACTLLENLKTCLNKKKVNFKVLEIVSRVLEKTNVIFKA